jgi:hypothetical protein
MFLAKNKGFLSVWRLHINTCKPVILDSKVAILWMDMVAVGFFMGGYG